MTGLGVYTKNLVQALLQEPRNGFEFSLLSKSQSEDWNTFQRLVWENSELPRRAKAERIDILHVPAFSPPLLKPCRTVATVHDLIGMIFSNQLGLPSRFYWGKWLPLSVKSAQAIIADSENTKRDLIKYLHLLPEKVKVIYPSGHEGFTLHQDATSFNALRERLGIKEKYFLAVGTLEPRKNLFRIVDAFSKFLDSKKRGDSYQLVVVGLTDFAHGKFVKLLSEKWSHEANPILLTGYIKREELNMLYSGAVGFIFPSLYEGFGIPILEAMASGTPVLTSHTSSLPEVAGDAAYLVDPSDTEAIAKGMSDLADDEGLRKALVRKGFNRIQSFSWRDAARKTVEVYEMVKDGRIA